MSEIAENSSTTEAKIYKPTYNKNVSGELDVFEATQYFSDFKEQSQRIQIQKQTIVAEHRQNRVHPETKEKLLEPRVVIVKPQEKEMTRGGGGKLTSFLNSLLRSAGLKKSKLKSTLEVVTPRGERRRRNSSVVITHAANASPISDDGALRLKARSRSFDAKHVKDLKKCDQKLDIRLCESLCPVQKVPFKDRNDDDVNGGFESDSNSESDLFDLDLFAKLNP